MRRDAAWVRGLSLVLLVVGGGLVAWGAAANAFGLDDGPGHVRRQIRFLALGFAGLALGVLISPVRRGAFFGWIAAAPAVAAGQCVALGAAFGIVTGLIEAAHQLVRRFGFGIFTRQPIDVVWMAPLSYLAMFATAGIVFAALRRVVPRLIRLPVVVFGFALAGAFAQCLFYPWHRASMAILAIGVAVQVARGAAVRPGITHALGRRVIVVGILWIALAATAIPVRRAWTEQAARASLPAAPADAPNLVLVVLDTVRADHLGCYGYGRATSPAIDALASRSRVFDRAISTSPWTLPGHASMFTGRYVDEFEADWLVPLEGDLPTLGERLTANGYHTGGFVGNLAYCLEEQGLSRGFLHYEDFHVSPGVLGFSTVVGERLMTRTSGNSFNEIIRNDAQTVTEGFLDWVDDVREDSTAPFFGFLNYYDAHTYYIAPEPFDTRFQDPPSHLVREWYSRRNWNDEEKAGFVAAYDGCIAYIDSWFEKLVEGLHARGLGDDTIIVVTADHGEMFWEHGLTEHGNCLYRPVLHAPLIVFDPRRPAGQRFEQVVTLRDLAATLLDLAGAEPDAIPGHSLAHHWDASRGSPAAPSPVRAGVSKGISIAAWNPHSKGDMAAVIAEGLHYIRNGDGTEELYDFDHDVAEQDNLVGDPRYAEALERLRALR